MSQSDLDEKTRAELAARNLKVVDLADYRAAQNCFLGSFFLCLATVIAALWYHFLTADNFYLLAPVVIGVGFVPAALSALFKGSFRRFRRALLMSLIPSLMVAFFTCDLFGMTLVSAYNDQIAVRTFVEKDFSRYDPSHSGQLSSDVLQQAIDRQSQLSSDKQRLITLKVSVVDLSTVGAAEKEQLDKDFDQAIATIRDQMISDAEFARLISARNLVYKAGQPLNPALATPAETKSAPGSPDPGVSAPAPVFVASRAQLLGYGQVLQNKHPLWLDFLQKVHLIDKD